MSKLSRRQHQLYSFLLNEWDDLNDVKAAPGYEDIMKHMRLDDRREAYEFLKTLMNKGYIERIARGVYRPIERDDLPTDPDSQVMKMLRQIRDELRILNDKIE